MESMPWPGAVALSGGGDSLALMLLLRDWAGSDGHAPPPVLIVDHALREGSAKDARKAALWARTAELKAQVLTWTGPKPGSDIEAAARAARYGLMGAWCAARGIRALYVGHTLEDQAETFLLRLARGSGIDGLSAMRARAPYPLAGHDDLVLARPLLDFPRAELRAFLQARQQDWLEDPMNADPRFARVKLRQAWPELTALGLLPERVAAAAGHLARARTALESMSDAWLKDHVRYETGRAIVDGAAFARIPPEIGLRALAHILGQVSGQTYRPRFERLERLYAALAAGQLRAARTLHGCRIGPAARRDARFGAGTLTILRERGRARRGTDPGQPA